MPPYSSDASKLDDPVDLEAIKKTRRKEDRRKQVLRKYMQKTTEDSEATTSEMSEKSFDNLFVEALSPQARSPMFDENKLAKMEKELAADRTHIHNLFGRTCFFLNCIFPIKLFFMLPMQMLHSGGWYFLLPLTVCAVVLALPMAFLELVLGQLTSQLVTLIFSRISPIAVGIGLFFPCLRLFFFILYRTEHRNVSFIWETIQKIFFTERNMVCWQFNGTDCFIPGACGKREVFYQGACYDRESLWKDKKITSQMNVRLSAYQLMQHHNFTSDAYIRSIPHVDRVLGEYADYANAHTIDAVFGFMLTVFICSLMGIRRVTKVMPLLHSLVALGLAAMFILMLISNEVRRSFLTFTYAMSEVSSAWALLTMQTWQTAACYALAMFAVGDGTLHAFGALNHFNNNIFFDLALAFGFWAGLVVFSIFFFGTIVVAGSGVWFREMLYFGNSENVTLMVTQLRKYPYMFSILRPMYYFSLTDEVCHWAGFILFLIIFILQIPPHVLMAENIMKVVLRTVPQLQNLNKGVIRHCLLLVYFILLGVIYTLSITVMEHAVKEHVGVILSYLLLIVIFYECVAVHRLYQIDRLVVNIRTMLERTVSAYRQAKSLEKPLYYLWSAIIPALAGLLFVTAVFGLMRSIHHHLLVMLVLFLAGLPIYAGTAVILRQWLKRDGRMHKLFRPAPDWGPFTIKDKKNVNWDERAARMVL